MITSRYWVANAFIWLLHGARAADSCLDQGLVFQAPWIRELSLITNMKALTQSVISCSIQKLEASVSTAYPVRRGGLFCFRNLELTFSY